MDNRAKRWGIALAVALTLAVGFCPAVRAQAAQGDEILKLFQQGLTAYKAGEYAEAGKAFSQVLAARPGMALALKMRDMAELGQFIEMRENEQLAGQADKIIELMMRAVRRGRRDIAGAADRLLQDFQSRDVATMGRAMVELRTYGQYAVPHLVQFLGLEDVNEQVLVARTVSLLAGMDGEACLPLIQVMRGTDVPLMKARVASVLGQIGEARALPALMDAWQDEDALQHVRDAAAEAIADIARVSPSRLGTSLKQYVEMSNAYYHGDGERVGFIYGLSGPVWRRDAQAGAVAYELVPNYLYYQTMASVVALEGLELAPGDKELRAVLLASLARRLALCSYFASDEALVGGQPPDAAAKADATDRATKLAASLPVVGALVEPSTVGAAMEAVLEVRSEAAYLILLEILNTKLSALAPTGPDAATVRPLVAGLNSEFAAVRYRTAVAMVNACPTGACGPADQIITIMSKSVRAAATRHALVIMDNLYQRNSLVTAVGAEGLSTSEANIHKGDVTAALAVRPAVDIVFVSVNTSQGAFDEVMKLLREDYRTRELPMYAVVDPAQERAELPDLPLLSPD